MADRALHLARTLIARTLALETARREDGLGGADRTQRTTQIEKVLAVELGITDGATIALVEAAVPQVRSEKHFTDRDVAALADFLRKQLHRSLTES